MRLSHGALLTGLLPACAQEHAEREPRGVTFATGGDTELNLDLFLHGDGAAAGLVADFRILHGSAHGGHAFTSEENLARIDGFLRRSFTHHE